MRRLAAFALVVLSCAPAKAQFGGAGGMGGRPATPAQSIEVEVLEMEQDADRTVLKEVILALARDGVSPAPTSETEKTRHAEGIAALRDIIASKKKALTARAAEIAERRTAGMRRPVAARAAQPHESDDKPGDIEKYENAKIEIQLLEAQINLLQPELVNAVNTLAAAEIAAGDDQARREKAEAARKEYDRIKAKLVGLNKTLYLERQAMLPMQMQMQMQMQGMGMGGMGGGFR